MTEQTFDPPRRWTDSEIAAAHAVDAMNDGRYALGHAFAAIAMRAKQAEDHAEQNALIQRNWGPGRADELPQRRPDTHVCFRGHHHDSADEAAACDQLDEAATQIGQIPAMDATHGAPDMTARCRFIHVGTRQGERVETECHAAIWLGPDAVWRHLDLQLDHAAVPPDWTTDVPRPS